VRASGGPTPAGGARTFDRLRQAAARRAAVPGRAAARGRPRCPASSVAQAARRRWPSTRATSSRAFCASSPGHGAGELRSHGFFYKPDGEASGLLGLPLREGGSAGAAHLVEGSASILFLRNDRLRFAELGALASRPARGAATDNCRASCVDWCGNARPVFWKGRVFALLGYELVEGRIDGAKVGEARRLDFSPRLGRAAP
jgi:hypothetical protein